MGRNTNDNRSKKSEPGNNHDSAVPGSTRSGKRTNPTK